jgi:predicted amidophosphoribosyltransferase
MRLFKRNQEMLCCPECKERLPEDATVCAMCGHMFGTAERDERFTREGETEEVAPGPPAAT